MLYNLFIGKYKRQVSVQTELPNMLK